jgi:hypothetical protein
MARSLLLVASGFALALVVVAVASLAALRSLSASPDTARTTARQGDADEALSQERTSADPDEAPKPDTALGNDDALSGDARLTMNNVALVAAPGVTLDVVRMRGSLRASDAAAQSGAAIDLEKPDSFDVVVDDAEVRVREDILQKLAWRVDRPLPGGARVVLQRVLVRKGRVVQEGTLALGPLSVPFTVTGTLAATKGGDVRVDVIDAHVGGVDTKQIADAFDINLRELLQRGDGPPKGVRGGDSLSLVVSPAAMETKPRMIAKVRSVRIEDDVVVVLLGNDQVDHVDETSGARAGSNGNSLVIAGGLLALGKMTMNGAVAELVDVDDDALMIDMKHFQRQLYASVCRATPQGVRIHMVDANDVRAPDRGRNAAGADRPVGK